MAASSHESLARDAGNSQDAPSTEGAPPGLARTAASGAAWLTAQKWVVRLSGLITIAVLARLVSPHDFGVVAAAAAVIPFVLLLSDLGLSTYLVQTEDPDEVVLSTGFWFSLSAAVVVGGGLFALVPVVVNALQVPDAGPVLQVLLASVPLVVAASVPTALLRRRMQFRTLALQGALGAGVAQAVAIVVAVAGGGAWALVAQALTTTLITSTLAWTTARWAPSWRFSWREFAAMTRFGYKIVAVELVAVLRNWGETAIVAVSLGTVALGYLTIAQRLVRVAQELGGSAVAPVAVVVLAKVRETPDRLRQAYRRASTLTYGVATPLLTYVAVAAPVVIPVLFGSRWGASEPVTRGLAIAGILTIGAFVDHGLFYALGRPGKWLVYATITDLVTVGTTALVVSRGLTAVAWAFVVVAVAATVVRWALVSKEIGTTFVGLARSFGSVVVCALGSTTVGLLVLTSTSGPLLVRAALVGVAVVTVHLVLLRLVLPATYADALELGPLPARVRVRLKRLSRLPS
ncbi:oligosaccharide flippase family protein [Cellulomonas fimi]|uniref:Oligosaccharide flippase family protein n=1 Tax=Cellulomonas fimi TaxID=1708 RepID=A0A7Y0M100_CELFI|nr:oligosaccharide flippase family protein [Cellulomonas fimi]NMR21439.1 oligosaccharide flippase family protein [Cellulomonas fimi]